MSVALHPPGVGLWRLKRIGTVGPLYVERAHTAVEAYAKSQFRRDGVGFNEVEFELVDDTAAATPGRRVGAERGSVRP